jgi:hypothetical protein
VAASAAAVAVVVAPALVGSSGGGHRRGERRQRQQRGQPHIPAAKLVHGIADVRRNSVTAPTPRVASRSASPRSSNKNHAYARAATVSIFAELIFQRRERALHLGAPEHRGTGNSGRPRRAAWAMVSRSQTTPVI